jgi:hypothetical protein
MTTDEQTIPDEQMISTADELAPMPEMTADELMAAWLKDAIQARPEAPGAYFREFAAKYGWALVAAPPVTAEPALVAEEPPPDTVSVEGA